MFGKALNSAIEPTSSPLGAGTKRRTRPDGWEIRQKATKHTNVTQERLVHEDTPLPDVLVEFLQDRGDRVTSR